MLIDIVANDGSPLLVTEKTIYGDKWQVGCGGAELAILTLCSEWTKAGHRVRFYNDPREEGASSFEQLPRHAFRPRDDRDIVIAFRSPNLRVADAKGLKVWLSMDQQTTGDFANFSHMVDKIVCISSFHAEYFAHRYGITNTTVIDLPVRVDDFKDKNIEKVPGRIIFTSVPARGLNNLKRMWGRIKQENPEASLVITSDYRLWGMSDGSNQHFLIQWFMENDVQYVGAIKREKYIEELLKADILLYPSNYDELFCIAVAEAQYAGVLPITSATGALPTTNMGLIMDVDAENGNDDHHFIDTVSAVLQDRRALLQLQDDGLALAKKRFSPKVILDKWNDEVFK